jgi:ribose-phosphate pyrophosphokinase
VRGADVFVIQPTCRPVNDNLVELLIMLDALRRASAERITTVIPYYGYARQDRKDRPRVPITSKLVADLLISAGTHRVLALDLHAGQIQGFFNIPVDHLYATPVTVDYFRRLRLEEAVVVSPMTGYHEVPLGKLKDRAEGTLVAFKGKVAAVAADAYTVSGDGAEVKVMTQAVAGATDAALKDRDVTVRGCVWIVSGKKRVTQR